MSKHSRKRTSERYNIDLTKKDEQNIINLLKENKFTYLYKSEKEEKRHFGYVIYKNIPIKILYERSNKGGIKAIITVYPFDVDEYNEMLNQQKEQFLSRIDMAIKFLKKNNYVIYKKPIRKE